MIKKSLFLLAAALIALPSLAPANGLSLNGLGSRAQGMGGAFVSIADDFSAVFWNPAGAAGFRQTTFGFYSTDLMPRVTYQNAPIDAKTKISHFLGFLAGYYKPVGDRIVLGVGIGTPSAQGVTWNGADFALLSGGAAYDRSNRIYVFSISPMAAGRISEEISFGAALNIDYGNLGLKDWGGSSNVDVFLPPVDLGQYEEAMNGWGVGATFGLLVKPVDKLSVGLTVKTPRTINFDGSADLSNAILLALPGSSAIERKITWPLAIAGGVSFRPVERLLLSADVQWTQWSRLDRITTAFADPGWAALMAADGKDTRTLDWKDATQLRFGAEYAVNPTTSVRAGYYRDPAPGPETTLDILWPTFTGNVFTVGLGETFGGLQLDLGLEYQAGEKRETMLPILETRTLTMHAVVPTLSASYRF